MKHVNLPLQEKTHKQLKFYCVKHETNMAEVIRQIVEEFFKKAKTKKR